jgi:hypothetical protein
MANQQIQALPPHTELHSLSSHAEVAAAALGSVYAANEFGKAINDHDNETDHFVKAAVAATVAVGAYEMLRRQKERHNSHPGSAGSTNAKAHPTSSEPQHHTKYVLEEAAGLYAFGKELLGDRKHHVAHLVLEAIGATGLIKDVRDRVG